VYDGLAVRAGASDRWEESRCGSSAEGSRSSRAPPAGSVPPWPEASARRGCASFPPTSTRTPSRQSPLEDYEWVLNVNVWGVIHGIRSFVPILLEQGGEGHIVNTASMAAVTSMPYCGIYT
jgi:NAD(P)-dependent dehydrogenase (short-subunit alcohol dehydrogenase family)